MAEKRERALQSLKNKYPDREFADDEDITDPLTEYMEELEDYKTRNSETNQKLIEVLDAEPELVEVIKDLIAGATLREALARHIDPQDLQPAEGEPDYEGWTKNRNERLSKMEERKRKEEELQANIDQSIAQAEAFATKKGMTPEETDAFLAKVDEVLIPILDGRIDETFLDNMYKALNYEEDLTNARELGKASVMNQKVIAQKEVTKGDGLPNISASGDEVKTTPKKKGYIETLKEQSY